MERLGGLLLIPDQPGSFSTSDAQRAGNRGSLYLINRDMMTAGIINTIPAARPMQSSNGHYQRWHLRDSGLFSWEHLLRRCWRSVGGLVNLQRHASAATSASAWRFPYLYRAEVRPHRERKRFGFTAWDRRRSKSRLLTLNGLLSQI